MTNKLMLGLNYLVMFLLLNFLWLTGIIVGLFFFGLIPATYALITLYLDPDLFGFYLPYRKIIIRFAKLWLQELKRLHLKVVVFPISFVLGYVDIFVVLQNQLMKAVFLWPITIVLCYIVLVMIQLLYIESTSKVNLIPKLKLSLSAPFLMPIESLLCMLTIGSFSILGLHFNGLFLIFGSTILFIMLKILQKGYLKKGLVIRE